MAAFGDYNGTATTASIGTNLSIDFSNTDGTMILIGTPTPISNVCEEYNEKLKKKLRDWNSAIKSQKTIFDLAKLLICETFKYVNPVLRLPKSRLSRKQVEYHKRKMRLHKV